MALISFAIEPHIKGLTFECNYAALFTHTHRPLTSVPLSIYEVGYEFSIDHVLSRHLSPLRLI